MDESKVDPRILEKRAKHAEYKRQKRAKMSEEERKKENEKERKRRAQRSHEEHEKDCERRRLRRRQMTPEQRQKDYERRLRKSGVSAEEYRLKENERKRLNSERRRIKLEESEEAKEEEFLKRQAKRERKRKEILDWKLKDPAKYREYLDKQRFKNAIRKANMTEEEKEEQRRKTYIYKQAKKATFTQEEIEARKRKSVAASIESQKKRWLEATEEEKEQRRVYVRIHQQKMKLRKNLFMEGLTSEEVKRMADEQEVIWWKEVYPEGKPPRRKAIQSKPIWTPEVVNTRNTDCEVEVFKYICVKCHPKWKTGPRKWQAVGVNSKLDLLHHVMEKHPFSYFPCSRCNLLKYSKKALDTHLTYCWNKDTSLS